MSIEKAELINFFKFSDERGSLASIDLTKDISFDIKRIYYLFDTHEDHSRGAHAHKKLEQVIIPISGFFDFTLDDGFQKKTFKLDKPWVGLYVPPMMWRDLTNFSPKSVCMVLASETYDEDDYFREYEDFLNAKRK